MDETTVDLGAELLPQLAAFFEAAGIGEPQRLDISRRLVEAAMHLPESSARYLTVAKIRDGLVPEVVYYDPDAAAGFLASLIGGLVGANSLILLGCAVVGCLVSLKQLRHRVSRAEGAVFWILYDSPARGLNRDQAQQRFVALCSGDISIRPEDFPAALQGLIRLGCVSQRDGSLCVIDQVIVR